LEFQQRLEPIQKLAGDFPKLLARADQDFQSVALYGKQGIMNPPESASHGQSAPMPSASLAIASLVLGLLGLVLSIFIVGALLGAVGLVLGAFHLRRSRSGRGMAGWGVGLGCLSVVASVGLAVLYYQGFRQITSMKEGMEGADFAAWEGVLAPDVTVRTLEGEQIQLSELRGRRVILDFWATWCPPCVQEIPHFIELHEETSRDELMIVGVSDEEEGTLKSFVQKQGINYPIGTVEEDLPSPYADVMSIPTTFVIDRNGVIQAVLVGYHELKDLRAYALADDYAGEAKSAPEAPRSELVVSDSPMQPVLRWSKSLVAETLAAGDWDGDGREELLVVQQGRSLKVLAADGSEMTTLKLPGDFSLIEMGRHSEDGPRLLGYSNWGERVVVTDNQGKELWSYPSGSGIDGAHWGDLDGDGTDEMVVGMNGAGGLHAVSADGVRLWHVGNIGNVWNQAIIPPREDQAALVFATEAGGTVRVYDAQGKSVRTIRPLGQYFSQLSAARVDAAGSIQGVAQGDVTVAFDENGRVAWQTPSNRDHAAWRSGSFAVGDLNSDGTCEWVFRDVDQSLVIVTPAGVKLASVAVPRRLQGFCVLESKDGESLLVTLVDGKVDAYALKYEEALK